MGLELEIEDNGQCCPDRKLKPFLLVPVPLRRDDPAARLMVAKGVVGFMVSQEYCEACGAQYDVVKDGPKVQLLIRKEG